VSRAVDDRTDVRPPSIPWSPEASEHQAGGFNSPVSQPTAFDFIGSAAFTVRLWPHFSHGKVRLLQPSGSRSAATRGMHIWQRRQRGRSNTYLTIEELRQVAASKLEEAAALHDGPKKQQILKLAMR
jgi:hypothetical protein